MASAADFLAHSQHPDGGWGYRAQTQSVSYVEPTAAAILALKDDAARGRARDFLLSIQRPDGGWGIAALDPESGWMTAWAVLALAQFPDAHDAATRGAQWLVNMEGLRVTDEPSRAVIRRRLQIDSTLRGWPWQPGDAAWVHPTALAILALGAVGKSSDSRARDGLVYLFDRAVASGGWNTGNPEMLDRPVPATIQDTAVALLALHAAGFDASDKRVANAIQFLRDVLVRAKTSAELAWGIYALRDWRVDVGDAPTRLNGLQNDDGSWRGNPFITAIAAMANQK